MVLVITHIAQYVRCGQQLVLLFMKIVAETTLLPLRLITLESLPLLVFTMCLLDSVFSFIKQSKFIKAEVHKGFTPKIVCVHVEDKHIQTELYRSTSIDILLNVLSQILHGCHQIREIRENRGILC